MLAEYSEVVVGALGIIGCIITFIVTRTQATAAFRAKVDEKFQSHEKVHAMLEHERERTLDTVTRSIDGLREEVRTGFRDIHGRLDKHEESCRTQHDDTIQRLTRLEANTNGSRHG